MGCLPNGQAFNGSPTEDIADWESYRDESILQNAYDLQARSGVGSSGVLDGNRGYWCHELDTVWLCLSMAISRNGISGEIFSSHVCRAHVSAVHS